MSYLTNTLVSEVGKSALLSLQDDYIKFCLHHQIVPPLHHGVGHPQHARGGPYYLLGEEATTKCRVVVESAADEVPYPRMLGPYGGEDALVFRATCQFYCVRHVQAWHALPLRDRGGQVDKERDDHRQEVGGRSGHLLLDVSLEHNHVQYHSYRLTFQ